MFGRVLLLACSLVLAGCARDFGEARETRLTIDGMRAFYAGDTEAIQAAETELAALYPPPTPYPNPCSREDYAQSRQMAFTGLLTDLERQSALSSSEEDRYARFQKVLFETTPEGFAPNSATCARSADHALFGAMDAAERVAVLSAARDIMLAWAAKLGHPIKES